MPDSFTGSGMIRLQPGDSGGELQFQPAALFLGLGQRRGHTLRNQCVLGGGERFQTSQPGGRHQRDGDGSSVADNVVTVTLSYPASAGPGLYHLEIVATLNDGSAMEFDFTRITARDV